MSNSTQTPFVPLPNGSSPPPSWEAERRALEDKLRAAIADRDRLQSELQTIKAQRDQYLKSLHALTWEDVDFDKDELLARMGKNEPFAEFLADLEKELGK